MEPYCPQISPLLHQTSKMELPWKPVITRKPSLMLLHSHTSRKKSPWKLNSLTSTIQKIAKWKWMSMKQEKKSHWLTLQRQVLALQGVLSVRTGACPRELPWSRLSWAFWRSLFLIHLSQKASEMVKSASNVFIMLCMTEKVCIRSLQVFCWSDFALFQSWIVHFQHHWST